MGARSTDRRRLSLLAGAALLGLGLPSGLTVAARADDDTFFSDLARADGAKIDAEKVDAAEAAVARTDQARADQNRADQNRADQDGADQDGALERKAEAVAPTSASAKAATLAGVASETGSAGASSAADLASPRSDRLPPSTGSLLSKGLKAGDTTGAIAPRQTIDRAEWMPDRPGSQDVGSKAGGGKTAAFKTDRADPEPDDAIVPPAAVSTDPLDHATGPAPAAAPALETLPPLNAALKAALDKRDGEAIRGPGAGERRKERAAVSFFYAAHGFAPLWSESGKPVAAVPSVLARLAKAGDDALTVTAPTGLETDGSPEQVVAAELALTDAVVAYARQASGSRVDPKTISPLIGSLPTLVDPAEVLDTIAGAGEAAGDKLAALNPSEPRYVALRAKLTEVATKRKPAAADGKPLPVGPSLRVGMHDKRVPLLRTRLGAPAADDGDDTLFDATMSELLADWQRGHDLPTTGALDRRTLAAMNGGMAAPSPRLEGTLIANMEMWRWMPRDLGADRIEVNIPDYQVRVFHDRRVVDEHRVVVGKTDTPTPLFSNAMKYLIVNPYWNVPQSIIKKEMLPKGGGSLAYLDGRGYEVGWHNGMPVVKQLPGPKNALGQIKFLFPNDYSVYLHDTPSKALFSASKRAFSHGCVRVDKPFGFAESVLNDVQPAGQVSRWSEERLEGMVGDKERYVNLPRPLPIHIEYFTASVEDGGRVKLREDVYGYAHAVAAALGHDSEPAPPVVKEKKERAPQVAERPHRRTVAEADPEPAPPPTASRGFWSNIFDPR